MRFEPREAISTFLAWTRAVWTARRTSVVSLLALLCFATGVSLLVPHAAYAVGVEDITNGFFSLVATALSYIVAFEGWLIAILVDVLVVFASYNGFATALPVQIGWVLIRDLVNMFFIVVLLVSAFATIIGYDTASFHYSRVLPKLLLMAILINFSKTIVQLAIDFSQVLMLTFVNAFRSAAAGNFIQMFGLNQMLTLRTDQTGQYGFPQLIPSYILAIIMLSIVISVLIIMVGFFIVRIVGLWLLLMFSPAAFFIGAVPDRLKKSLSGSVSEYWSKLGSLLAGGPIMAFFIWLALALTQNGGGTAIAESLNVYQSSAAPAAATTAGTVAGFITGIGTGPQIASFVIGVALMLIGLQTAVKTAGDVSKTLGSAAGKIKPFFAFTAGAAAARFAGKAGYAGARAAYRPIDRRLDLTASLSRTALKVPLLGTALREPLAKGVTLRRKEREADATKLAELTKGMTADEKATFAERATGIMPTPSDKLAKAKILSDFASVDSRTKATKARSGELEKNVKARWMKEGKYTGKETEAEKAQKEREIKREAHGAAMRDVDAKAASQLEEARKLLTNIGAKDQLAEIDKILEKDPQLNPKEFENSMAKINADPEKEKALSAGAISRGDVLMALLGPDVVKRNDKGEFTGIDEARYDQFKERRKDQKQLVANVEALVGHLRESPNVDVKTFDKAVVQNDARGRLRLYDAAGGAQMLSHEEEKAVTGLRTNGVGGINKALDLGVPMSQIQGIVGKAALDAHLEGELRSASMNALAATTDDDYNKAFSVLGNIANQLKDPALDSPTQIKYLAAMRTAAPVLHRAATDGTRLQRKMAFELIDIGAKRNQEIALKNPAARTSDEKAVLSLIGEVKKQFPTTKEEYTKNNPTNDPLGYGGASYRRAPNPIDQALRGIET